MEITCFDCYYHDEIGGRHLCFGQKYAPEIDPNLGCDNWKHDTGKETPRCKMTMEKENVINTIEMYFNTVIELTKTVNCNNCKDRETCSLKPESGQLIRYNCPIPKLLDKILRSISDE